MKSPLFNTCLFALFVYGSSCAKKTLFQQMDASHTGIHFNNTITESDSLNPLKNLNIYNGGGVGIGDFNNDGLQDIYFAGNMGSNKLYLNKGSFEFEDITETAGVNGNGKWCRGVAVVDINNDGLMDIYVAASMSADSVKRENLLYINTGKDENGLPYFKEQAAAYGLNDNTHTTMAYFFDYDNDGDLDVYLVVNEILDNQNPSKFRPMKADGSHPSTGRLYRNNWNESLKHPVYENVSFRAGITIEGYGHAAVICDINNDGWKDIYVANDFVPSNILYINNGNGTFTDRTKDYFKHTSTFAMGVDMQDINNDGLMDVVELDMNPEDNYRKKMMLGANSYQTFQNFDQYQYQYQYSRNTLQLNMGPRKLENDSVGAPIFSEIACMAGIAETDWSWAPVVNDFDHDGLRDIIITNGYPRDVTDHDFIIYRMQTRTVASPMDVLDQIPQVKLRNYAFKNKGNLTFANATTEWGMSQHSFSGGAAYADLDNDGDMDLIISNINDNAFVYRNNVANEKSETANYINISFSGDELNKNGLGAKVHLYYGNGKQQVYEHSPYRGYLSSHQAIAHFGVGNATIVDSVIVEWPDHKKQKITAVKTNQLLVLHTSNATVWQGVDYSSKLPDALFKEVTQALNVKYNHNQVDFIDFNIQKLLPHKFSEYAPAIAIGDIDGNGLDDMVCGGSFMSSALFLLQQPNGQFVERKIYSETQKAPDPTHPLDLTGSANDFQDGGVLLFDADNDGDLDLYVTGAGYAQKANTPAYQDRLYVNDGKGNFTLDKAALPENFASKLCVRAADFDKDGDLDLFVGARIQPWEYPKPVSGFIFRNDTKDGKIVFKDVTPEVAPELTDIGLISDAVFSDFDNDGWQDLVIAGEWMPVTFLKNEKGVLKKNKDVSGINDKTGWWNTIAPGDFDKDGDIDYIVGNLGLNSLYKASNEEPVYITAGDFDNNGSYDAFLSLFLPVTHDNPERKEFSAHTRDDVTNQMVSLRSTFQSYKTFAKATITEMFTPEQMKGALRLKADFFSSALIRNDGNGKFSIIPLPTEAQFSALNGICINDFNADGNLDVLINGNDFGTDISIGRYNALNGLLMQGDGKGNFSPLSILESGIFIPGNGKAMVELRSASEKLLVAASQHKGPLKVFEGKKDVRLVPVQPLDVLAEIRYKNGSTERRELYYGYSLLSQSGRFFTSNTNMESVTITDSKGNKRNVSF